ncbi:MAG: PD-(D/E)XK nuclease family protein [Oligoflexia bacterium]|nr:PD-(D/E)XK nuclease family protein [Oligoflexia bacterium]
MTISRQFLGWEKPLLQSAAQYIAVRHRRAEFVDCSQLTVVVPGARAGRRLIELLVEAAEGLESHLLSPAIVTTGALPELCYHPSCPVIGDSGRLLAWIAALKATPETTLQLVLKRWELPDFARRLAFANTIDQLYSELAANQLSFADMSKFASEFGDEERWQALAEIYSAYLHELSSQGLSDKHVERCKALADGRVNLKGELILVGTADINKLSQAFVEKLSCQREALIFAPQSLADRFDAMGALICERWENIKLDIPDAMLSICLNPAEQADAIIYQLGRAPQAADQISIGLGDAEILPYLHERLSEYDLVAHSSSGRPLSDSSPARLLALVQRFIASRSASDFGSLVRHPSILHFISSKSECSQVEALAAVDSYQSKHLQRFAIGNSSEPPPAPTAVVLKLSSVTQELISPLLGPKRKLMEWAQIIHSLLSLLYPNSEAEGPAIDAIADSLSDFVACPASAGPTLQASEALELLSQGLRRISVEEAQRGQALEVLGWLELQLDDAPTLIIAGFNEGLIPESVNSDLLLPDTLREKAGLQSNSRRFARDLFILQSILHSRQRLHIICGRENASRDALAPSRLLCLGDKENLAARILRFYAGQLEARLSPLPVKLNGICNLPSPPPPLGRAPDSAAVSGFKAYLECKYRYYLGHVLGLHELHDHQLELSPTLFGEIAHLVLLRFGRSAAASSSEAQVIRAGLSEILEQTMGEHFGTHPYPAVLVQKEILNARLNRFAEAQALWRKDGWTIHALETSLPENSGFTLKDGSFFHIRGRVDRIDLHADTQRYAIIDYKTGDMDYGAEKVYTKSGWKDPQLPLYQHGLKERLAGANIELFYVNISAKESSKLFSRLELSSEQYQQALHEASAVAQAIHDQDFWPPKPIYSASDGFSLICRDGATQP